MTSNFATGTRVDHSRYGEGIISSSSITSYTIYFAKGGEMQISKSSTDLEAIEESQTSNEPGFDLNKFDQLLHHFLENYGGSQEEVSIGDKWRGGNISLYPGNRDLKEKTFTIESFFHKIVLIRDRLRVLEQNINSHSKLDDTDKVNLQQYITRIYGSLTSFNLLFAEKDHYFVGAKGE